MTKIADTTPDTNFFTAVQSSMQLSEDYLPSVYSSLVRGTAFKDFTTALFPQGVTSTSEDDLEVPFFTLGSVYLPFIQSHIKEYTTWITVDENAYTPADLLYHLRIATLELYNTHFSTLVDSETKPVLQLHSALVKQDVDSISDTITAFLFREKSELLGILPDAQSIEDIANSDIDAQEAVEEINGEINKLITALEQFGPINGAENALIQQACYSILQPCLKDAKTHINFVLEQGNRATILPALNEVLFHDGGLHGKAFDADDLTAKDVLAKAIRDDINACIALATENRCQTLQDYKHALYTDAVDENLPEEEYDTQVAQNYHQDCLVGIYNDNIDAAIFDLFVQKFGEEALQYYTLAFPLEAMDREVAVREERTAYNTAENNQTSYPRGETKAARTQRYAATLAALPESNKAHPRSAHFLTPTTAHVEERFYTKGECIKDDDQFTSKSEFYATTYSEEQQTSGEEYKDSLPLSGNIRQKASPVPVLDLLAFKAKQNSQPSLSFVEKEEQRRSFRTYPQGILKKEATSSTDKTANSGRGVV